MTDNYLIHPHNIVDTKRAAEFCGLSVDEFEWFTQNFVETPKPITTISCGYLWDLEKLSSFSKEVALWKEVKTNFSTFLKMLEKTSSTLPQDATETHKQYADSVGWLNPTTDDSSDQSDEVAENGSVLNPDYQNAVLLAVLYKILEAGKKNPTFIQWTYVGEPFDHSREWVLDLKISVEVTEEEFQMLQDFHQKRNSL